MTIESTSPAWPRTPRRRAGSMASGKSNINPDFFTLLRAAIKPSANQKVSELIPSF